MTYKTEPAERLVSTAEFRKTQQFLMPARLDPSDRSTEAYNVYPSAGLGSGKIFSGFDSLAGYIVRQKTVVIDGYAGIFWNRIQTGLQRCFDDLGYTVNWIRTDAFLKPEAEVDDLIRPFLGEHTSVWGTKTRLSLSDFFTDDIKQLNTCHTDLNIVIGTGAALSQWDVPLIYFDLPKNELQFRMRAGSALNLAATETDEAFQMYKRAYFVDWVVLNQHKKKIFNRMDVFADGQWPDTVNWCGHQDLQAGLKRISQSVVRVRPWFEPGAWGGQWMKNNIDHLNKEVVNLAWSFELITPENGIVFESDGNLLEVSFDTLMFTQNRNLLGRHTDQFGDEFPIRFDFLDTIGGGNLSIQCHPRLKYIQDHFGENITQDETYYILEAEEGAKVYLGFQEDIDPAAYREALEESQTDSKEINIEHYVQVHPAKKHDLFLIPNATVHSAARGNLVLEISATPYIFTFKMYDWVRLGLDGQPRPINIEHAFNNLDFSRKGEAVKKTLISKPRVIEKTAAHQLVHLPTHEDHFYDIQRIEFDHKTTMETEDVCHVMMLVEGQAVLLETADGTRQKFAYAETFIIPAAAGAYTLSNLGASTAKVIKAFLK